MNINVINRLTNEYRAKINEAVMIRDKADNKATEKEALCYQEASIKSGKIAAMTIGAESLYWTEKQQECEKKIIRIKNELSSIGRKKEIDNDNTKSGRMTKDDYYNDEFCDEVDPKLIDSWFLTEKPKQNLDKVLGLEEEKKVLRRCISYNKLRELADYLNIPTVHSFFFYGPPGCGKTYTIEGFIRELMDQGYKCLKVMSKDIHAQLSGDADRRLNALFDRAISEDKCVIFIDEIDGICQSRDLPHLSDFNMQLTTTFLNCFNKLMKAGEDKKSIYFISATNYPSNVDTAMLDRVHMIQIPMPNMELREKIFRDGLDKITLEKTISYSYLAQKSIGYSVRDINRVIGIILGEVYNSLADILDKGDNMDSVDAIEMIKNGKFIVTKKLLDDVFKSYRPKPLTDIERSLNEFEEKS